MPPVILGTTIFISFLVIWLVRHWIERRYVLAAQAAQRVKRQFIMDICLCIVAGLGVSISNWLLYDFPPGAGISFLVGCIVLGFFVSLDMALLRERQLIRSVMQDDRMWTPPKELYPMSRKFSLVAFGSTLFVVTVLIMAISRDFAWLADVGRTADSLAEAKKSVMIEIIFIVTILFGLITNLILSYSKNLKMLFHNETGVLEKISNGNLSEMVPVVTSDEFGYIAGHTNTMIKGLRHRSELLTSLKLAEEVQQNLLPKKDPEYPGTDISGKSIYCDQTGGDYFDYLELPDNRLGVVVADAADHGIGSALQMTTARAFLRYAVQRYEKPERFINGINHHLTRDSEETGRFMTLFLLEIDTAAKSVRWVRAGHDPAFLFNPHRRTFSELNGAGIAMGIDPEYRFRSYRMNGWTPGSIVIICTDGIREARNDADEMFGNHRLQSIVEKNADRSAAHIQQQVFASLKNFRKKGPMEDDATLVIVKLL